MVRLFNESYLSDIYMILHLCTVWKYHSCWSK